VNRLINIPVFAFLSLMALLFLFSDQLSRLSVPRSTFESGNAIGRAAVDKAALMNPHTVDLLSDPAGIKVLFIDPRVDSSVSPPFSETIWKIPVAPSYRKDHVHSRFNVKMVYRTKLAAKRATGNHSRSAGLFSGLSYHFGAFILHLQAIGIANRFLQQDAIVGQTNGRPKENRINQRRIKGRSMSSFRQVRPSSIRKFNPASSKAP
jgi:hypothetical protein